MIAPLSAGRVEITWRQVACEVSGPIAYHFKDGVNPFYAAIQLRNHRYPIAKVEVERDGAYVEIARLEYNYFVEASGLGDGPYALRVTDTRGHVLEDVGGGARRRRHPFGLGAVPAMSVIVFTASGGQKNHRRG